jgi:Flp pilus assembly protein TadD
MRTEAQKHWPRTSLVFPATNQSQPGAASLPERTWRWCRRKPTLASAVAIAVLAMALSVFFAIQTRQAGLARLVERRQSAVDKALLTAWSGDFEATEAALREAELAGASGGQTRMLRGQLAFLRGEFEQAVRELEQAVKLWPESVAARGMLVTALNRAGKWQASRWGIIQPLWMNFVRHMRSRGSI